MAELRRHKSGKIFSVVSQRELTCQKVHRYPSQDSYMHTISKPTNQETENSDFRGRHEFILEKVMTHFNRNGNAYRIVMCTRVSGSCNLKKA